MSDPASVNASAMTNVLVIDDEPQILQFLDIALQYGATGFCWPKTVKKALSCCGFAGGRTWSFWIWGCRIWMAPKC